HVFDFVQGVLDVRLQVGTGSNAHLAQRVAGIDGQHRFHVEVLAPFQVFEQAHAIGGPIAPGIVLVAGAFGDVVDGFLPVETGGDGVAFEVIAAGKTKERRVHAGEQLHDVFAV